MAIGKMLVKKFCYDKRIWELQHETILVFVCFIPHIENDGTLPYDLEMLESMCMPRLKLTEPLQKHIDRLLKVKESIVEIITPQNKHEKQRIKFIDFQWANSGLDFMRKRKSRQKVS